MSFWTTLRWAGALSFVLIVLVILVIADRNDAEKHSSNQDARRAPLFVR